VSQIQFKQGTTTKMTTTRSYDNLNRLLSVSSVSSAASALSFSYPTLPTNAFGWLLQSQTNDLGTNWVNVPASMHTNQMTVPLNSTNGSVFFRLMKPQHEF
jgi:hypothetical protein